MKRFLAISWLLLGCMCCSVSMDAAEKSAFSWSANATMTSNYIWRGLYCGGPSLQVDATIDYAGFFANMWWNVGATDWTWAKFNPEVDISIGFSRWGLSLYYIHCFYFDQYPDGSPSKFFDFKNHPKGGGGATGEWRVAYRVSDRLPLSCLVGVRTFSRDGYMVDGELKRAYSTYIELGYDFALGENWQLDARLGMTPAKSLYTGFQGDFAITMIGLKLHKTWELGQQEDENIKPKVKAFAHVMLQPWQLSKDNLIKPIAEAGDQKLNMAVGCSVAFGN
ncbi:MAG: hypothetical protein IKB46_03125 [Paludibacteraceae bacterium]|nr:hypothetical protein [Paludibacteraceae bacterium]